MEYRDNGGSFEESKQSRPLGVTLLAILQIVGIVVKRNCKKNTFYS